MTKLKIDLSILKRHVAELEASLAKAEEIRNISPPTEVDKMDFIVELSKATGLLTGITKESILLIADVDVCSTGGGSLSATDKIDMLMNKFKAPGSTNHN